VSYDHEMRLVLIDMRFLFGEINADDQLTPEDKKRIKEFFLQNMIAPKARKLLESISPKNSAKPHQSPRHRKPAPTQTANSGLFHFPPSPFADDAWKQLFSCPPFLI
jgi:hypothetical protein